MRLHEHWPEPLVGAVFSATPLGYGTATILGGRLADRFPPRPLCAIAVAMMLTGFATAFLWPSPYTFIGAYSFWGLGLGGGLALTASLGAAVQAFPARAGTVGGALTGVYAVGSVVQVPVVQALVAATDWLTAVRWTGGVLAAVAVVALLAMPGLPAPRRPAGEEHTPTLVLARRRRIWAGSLAVACATPLGGYAFVNVGQWAQGHRLGVAVAAGALVAASLGNAAGRLGVGLLSDVLGPDLVLVAIALAALASGAAIATGGTVPVVAGALGAGAALGGAAGGLARMAADAAPDAPHSAFGLLFAGFASGVMAGPLVGPLAGPGTLPWLALAALGLPGLALAAVRRRA